MFAMLAILMPSRADTVINVYVSTLNIVGAQLTNEMVSLVPGWKGPRIYGTNIYACRQVTQFTGPTGTTVFSNVVFGPYGLGLGDTYLSLEVPTNLSGTVNASLLVTNPAVVLPNFNQYLPLGISIDDPRAVTLLNSGNEFAGTFSGMGTISNAITATMAITAETAMTATKTLEPLQDGLYSTAGNISAGNGLILGGSDNDPNWIADNTANALAGVGYTTLQGGIILGRFNFAPGSYVSTAYGGVAAVDFFGDNGSTISSRTGSFIGVALYNSGGNIFNADWSALGVVSLLGATNNFISLNYGSLFGSDFSSITNSQVIANSSLVSIKGSDNLQIIANEGSYVGGYLPAGTTIDVSDLFYYFGNGIFTGSIDSGDFIGNGTGITNAVNFSTNTAPTGITWGTTHPDYWVKLTNTMTAGAMWMPCWTNH
ncbi:MAG TPA: hypothetical protein VGI03_07060 [Verrucomicrobiae bacterium]